MARIDKRVAAKDYPNEGIKKGDTYYTWTPYRQAPRRSKTYPTPSQTDTSKWSAVYAAQEAVAALGDNPDKDDLLAALESARDAVQEVGDEYGEAFEAMPGNSQAEERQAKCEELVGELEDLIGDLENIEEPEEPEEGEEPAEEGESVEDQVRDVAERAAGLDWSTP